MNDRPRFDQLSDKQLLCIHQICEDFERQFSSPESSSLESFLHSVDPQLKKPLFTELLAMELELKEPGSVSEVRSNYLERFPEYQDEVSQVVDEYLQSPNASGQGSGGSSLSKCSNRSPLNSGESIGERYRLLEKIGEGGMGEVWVAQQTEPIQRKVAIKLIKTGLNSKEVIARFEQERQSIALMDHPNIATVLDAGITQAGLPFFVMEFVNGLPLHQYCDQKNISPVDRLHLFIPICNAIQHAHQKGIVHRDLKPTNIVVCEIDGKPVPKVIDFGVAKAVDQQTGESGIETHLGTIVGTLVYMSPEQAATSGQDIDTRSDIYSLGVILYELLSGLRPIDLQNFQDAGLVEMVRVLQEEDPPKPSTKLSSSELISTESSYRSAEAKQLAAWLRGELDCIAMKCLEKNRERRYETANALCRDIQRYLTNQPVEARPPSTRYRLEKFVLRNKQMVIAGAILFLALIAGIVGTGTGLVHAEHARADAVKAQLAESKRAKSESIAKDEARKQTRIALKAVANEKSANRKAQRRLVQIEKWNDILTSIFRNLDPKEIVENKRPLQAILADQLDYAAKQLDEDSIEDSEAVAKLQSHLGQSFLGLSVPSKAIPLLEKSNDSYLNLFGPEHRETLASAHNLGVAHLHNGDPKSAISILESTLKVLKKVHSSSAPLVAATQYQLAQSYSSDGDLKSAIELYRKILKTQGDDLEGTNREVLAATEALAGMYKDSGQPYLALDLLKKSFDQQKKNNESNHPNTLASMINLANVYRDVGNFEKALPMLRQALELTRATMGENHDLTLQAIGELGNLYKNIGKFDLAIELLEDRRNRSKRELGASHPDTLSSMSDLASGYQAAGRKKESVGLYRKTLDMATVKMGEKHYNTLLSMNNLAMSLQTTGEPEAALELFLRSLRLMKETLPPNHPGIMSCTGNLAVVYEDLGKLDFALPLYEKTLEMETKRLGPKHPSTLRSTNNLATAYWGVGKLEKSIPLFRQLVTDLEALVGRKHPNTQMTVINLGVNLKDAKKIQEALPLLEEGYRSGRKFPALRALAGPQLLDAYASAGNTTKLNRVAKQFLSSTRRRLPKDSLPLAVVLSQVGTIKNRAKLFSQAEELLVESLAIEEKLAPKSWRQFHVRSLLGTSFSGQGRDKEAEKALTSSYQKLKDRYKTLPADAKTLAMKARSRLIQFLKKTGQSEKAGSLSSELKFPKGKGAK